MHHVYNPVIEVTTVLNVLLALCFGCALRVTYKQSYFCFFTFLRGYIMDKSLMSASNWVRAEIAKARTAMNFARVEELQKLVDDLWDCGYHGYYTRAQLSA